MALHLDSIPSFYFGFSNITLRFDPFSFFQVLRYSAQIRSLFFFRVLLHCSQIRSRPFDTGSLASHPDLIPSICFGFSDIALVFNPFVLFRVVRHRARIRSLRFVSRSPASRSIPSFFFGFSSIAHEFDLLVLFRVLWHCS